MMRALAIVMCVAGSAAADASFAWNAPSACPSISSIEARVEQRLGRALDHALMIRIAVTETDGHFVARLELGNEVRALTSTRCDELADAIAIVVARAADEHRIAPVRVAAVMQAAAETTEPIIVHRDLSAREVIPTWALGVRLSGVSGIGIVPEVGLGAEIAVTARHDELLGELAATKWLASGADRTNSHVEVGLGVTAARIGWHPNNKPLRAWIGAEVGSMDGQGTNLSTSQPNSGRWFAAGAGFAVAWPIEPWLRVVGASELLIAIQRVRFEQSDGVVIYAPSPMSARATLGLEVGWQ
jgi:hypothetical protein